MITVRSLLARVISTGYAMNDDVRRVSLMASDSHKLMMDADLACKGHARIRNATLIKLHREYGLDLAEVAHLTGIPERTVRNAVFRVKAKEQQQ